MTQDQFEKKYNALRKQLAKEGISSYQLDRAEFCEIYNDRENTCSDKWLDLFEDTARNS